MFASAIGMDGGAYAEFPDGEEIGVVETAWGEWPGLNMELDVSIRLAGEELFDFPLLLALNDFPLLLFPMRSDLGLTAFTGKLAQSGALRAA